MLEIIRDGASVNLMVQLGTTPASNCEPYSLLLVKAGRTEVLATTRTTGIYSDAPPDAHRKQKTFISQR